MSFKNFNRIGSDVMHPASAIPITNVVQTYSDLPTPGEHTGEFYIVSEAEGSWLLARKEAGIYRDTGSEWVRLGDWVEAFSDSNFEIYNETNRTKKITFDASAIGSLTTRKITMPNKDVDLGLVGQTSFSDDTFSVYDNVDNTKAVTLETSEITTGTTRTLTVPDSDGTIALLEDFNLLNDIYAEQLDQGTTLDNIESEQSAQGIVLDNIDTELAAQGLVIDDISGELLDQGTTLDSIETETLDQGTTLDSIDTNISGIASGESVVSTSLIQYDQVLYITDEDFNEAGSSFSNTVVSGTGQNATIKLDASGSTKDFAFTDSADYTVSSALLEVAGGYGQHVGLDIPASCLFFNKFDSNDANYSKNGGSLTGTFGGGDNTGSVSGEELVLTNDDSSFYRHDALNNFSVKTTGTLKEFCFEFDFTSNEAGIGTTFYPFSIGDTTTNNSCVQIWWLAGGDIYAQFYDSSASIQINTKLANFNPTQDTKYRIRLNAKIDSTTPASTVVSLYQNGTQIGSNITGVAFAFDETQWDYLWLGSRRGTATNVNAKYDNLTFFNDGDYAGTTLTKSLGYYTTDNLYIDTKISGEVEVLTAYISAALTATIPDGNVSFLLTKDSGATYDRWNGSAWVQSSSPTLRSDSNSIATITANVASYTYPNNTLGLRIFIQTNNIASQTKVDLVRFTVVASYVPSGEYTSSVFDSGIFDLDWDTVGISTILPALTSAAMQVRASNYATDILSEAWGGNIIDGEDAGVIGRYIQFHFDLATSDPMATPEIIYFLVNFLPETFKVSDDSVLAKLTDIEDELTAQGIVQDNQYIEQQMQGLSLDSIDSKLTEVDIRDLTHVSDSVKIGDGVETADVITTNGNNGLVTISPGHVSTLNSTATPLLAGATYTGTSEDITNFGIIGIAVITSHASATDGLSVEFSTDNINWDHLDNYTIAPSVGKTFSFQAVAKYFRVRYTNGGTNQTYFRLQTLFKPYYVKPSSHRIADAISSQDDAELVKAILSGVNPSGTFVNFGATTSGNFKVSLEELENAISTNSNTQLKTTQYTSDGTEIVTHNGLAKNIICDSILTSNCASVTPSRSLHVEESTRLIGTAFDGSTIDSNFWTTTLTNGGSSTANGGVTLQTNTTANGTSSIKSVRRARYVGSYTLDFNTTASWYSVADTDNIRRIGVYDDNNGLFFQLDGTTFSIGSRTNRSGSAIDTLIDSGDFNGEVSSFDPSTDMHRLQILISSTNVYFLIDEQLIHTLTFSLSTLPTVFTLPINIENINDNGNDTNNILFVIGAVINRLGKLKTNTTYKYIGSNTTTVCKYTSGILHNIINLDNAGSLTVYDNSAASGDIIAVIDTAKALGTLSFDASFNNGLTVVSSLGAKVTIVYE